MRKLKKINPRSNRNNKNIHVWREPIAFSLERAMEYLRAVLLDKSDGIIKLLNDMESIRNQIEKLELVGNELKIDWLDSCSFSGWRDIKDMKYAPCRCISYGKCIHQDNEIIVLAGNMGEETEVSFEQCNGAIAIPIDSIQCVRKMAGFTPLAVIPK